MKTCDARQHSDQMICHQCGLVWDTNDPEPPSCKKQQTVESTTQEQMMSFDEQPDDDTALKLVLTNRNPFEQVRHFNLLAGNSDDHYNVRQTALYVGLQCEEFAEKLTALNCHTIAHMLQELGMSFKRGIFDDRVEKADRVALLDADIDQLVVSIGSVLSQGADIHGAFGEVDRSNMSKVHEDGTLHKDRNGKIVKPEHYSPPDLTEFVCREDRA